jgi:dihydroorotate dehydrogenase (NAD+) catalytic subunit
MLPTDLREPYRLGDKTVQGRFVIPSGIRCTHASTILRCFLEVPAIGVITTKSISAQPRKGYREPLYARYAPGCYINAVGLANPGAAAYLAEFDGMKIPDNKFLLVSVFGSDVESFLDAARTLRPIADGFELNMSCPHAKGYGAQVGQDMELMRTIVTEVARAVDVPVFVKFAATFPDVEASSREALAAGAAGLTLTNTIGPAVVPVGEAPILHNKYGGLSGDGIRPLGLRTVEQARRAAGAEPVIIGMGGIASPDDVRAYARAGADLYGVGSALTGLDGEQFAEYLKQLETDAAASGVARVYARGCESTLPMEYLRTRIAARHDYDATLFKLTLEDLPQPWRDGDLAGKFLFLCVPGVGEKPFAVFSCSEKSVVIRTVGEFTRHLAGMSEGQEIFVRGPYGKGVPVFEDATLVFAGGGTGIASLLEIAHQQRASNEEYFVLGARTRAHLCDVEMFESLGPVLMATDDGSAGFRGFVPDLLRDVVAELPAERRRRLAFINCGPEPMVRKCFEIERELVSDDRIIGSIEYITSCGVGICGKCSSPSGALTCVDGPFLVLSEFENVRSRCGNH